METKTFIYKVPDGKMVRIIAEIDDNIIKKINITGDFFIHPEESIIEIEKSIVGCNKETGEDQLMERIEGAVNATKARLIGVDPKSMAFAIHNAMVSQ